jgi:[ribosomal protein S18]-alanine N-acetyltransferase
MTPAPHKVRRMTEADLDRVMEIAESLKEAPHWSRSAYLAALDSQGAPARIALVAETALETESLPIQLQTSASGSPPFRKEREKEGASTFFADERTPFGSVAGFAVASVLGPQAELEMIAVAADSQRGGVACGIFTTLVKELRSMCAGELLLEVRASNRPALEFYRSQGFEETGRRPRYYSDPVEDAVLMLLQLR